MWSRYLQHNYKLGIIQTRVHVDPATPTLRACATSMPARDTKAPTERSHRVSNKRALIVGATRHWFSCVLLKTITCPYNMQILAFGCILAKLSLNPPNKRLRTGLNEREEV